MRGTLFGSVHSYNDLHLIQQSIEISPATPKLNLVDIPGANGAKDMSEALGIGLVYDDREIKWTFALYPEDDWVSKRNLVASAINGRILRITPDDERGWYYEGRPFVSEYKTDKTLHQITVTATVRPYRKRGNATTVRVAGVGQDWQKIGLRIGDMPLIPTITVDTDMTIRYKGSSYALSTGTHVLPALYMAGSQIIEAKAGDDPGTILISWQEGAL